MYLYNIPLDHPDAPKRTPELMEAFEDLAYMGQDYASHHFLYLREENFLCENALELMNRTISDLLGYDIDEEEPEEERHEKSEALQAP